MTRKIIILVIAILMLMVSGCNEHLMPDQFNASTFRGPMQEDYYIFGFSWDIPQPQKSKE